MDTFSRCSLEGISTSSIKLFQTQTRPALQLPSLSWKEYLLLPNFPSMIDAFWDIYFIALLKFLIWHDKLKKAKKSLIFPLKYLNKIFQKAGIFWWKWSSKLITVHWNRIVSDKIFFSKYFLCVCRLKYGLSILSLSLGLFYLSKDLNRKITQQANFGFSDPNFHLLTY